MRSFMQLCSYTHADLSKIETTITFLIHNSSQCDLSVQTVKNATFHGKIPKSEGFQCVHVCF